MAAAIASMGFVVLIVGITYFAILVFTVHHQAGPERAAAYRELGLFLSGRLPWYRDARLYGGVALLLALVSLLFGVHRLARITIPVAGIVYVGAYFYGDQLGDILARWATGN